MARQRGIFDRIRRWWRNTTTDEPPPKPPPPPPGPSEDEYSDAERAALRHIDSYHLEDLPPRTDSKGIQRPAEYNRDRVREQLEDLPLLELTNILEMDRNEFRGWARAKKFMYH